MRAIPASGRLAGVTTSMTTPTDLAQRVADGERLKYLMFWGHRPQSDGNIGAGCLSQWWAGHPFTVGGEGFATAEHYMMWRKAMLFGDQSIAARIVAAGHPRQAKMLGRQVGGFDEPTWELHRFQIVVDGSVAKFGQHRELGRFLAGTDERVLVEASPTDRVWGIGLSASDPRADQPDQWPGRNLLGFALMRARDLLAD